MKLGAAIYSNCDPCFPHHFDVGQKLGLSEEDIRKAVEVDMAVKAEPHRKVLETADRYLALEEDKATVPGDGCACGTGNCC